MYTGNYVYTSIHMTVVSCNFCLTNQSQLSPLYMIHLALVMSTSNWLVFRLIEWEKTVKDWNYEGKRMCARSLDIFRVVVFEKNPVQRFKQRQLQPDKKINLPTNHVEHTCNYNLHNFFCISYTSRKHGNENSGKPHVASLSTCTCLLLVVGQ